MTGPSGPSTLAAATAAALSADGSFAGRIAGFRPRDGQIELARAVAHAIDAHEPLVAEAGTGIGKTFAYLVPAVLSGARTLVSTGSRQLQDQLLAKDVPRVLAALGTGRDVVVLKGRANYVCPYHLKINRAAVSSFDPGMASRLTAIEQFARTDPVGDRSACTVVPEDDAAWPLATSTTDNCIGQQCPDLHECPVARARKRAHEADILIVNHHLYCADLALRSDSLGELLPDMPVRVFDEAHQLPEIATEFFGESVSTRQLQELARDAERLGLTQGAGAADWRGLRIALDRAARAMRAALPPNATRMGLPEIETHLQRTGEAFVQTLDDALGALGDLLDALVPQAERSAEFDRLMRRTDDLGERLARWHRRRIGEQTGDGSFVWLDAGPQHVILRSTPLDAARRLGRGAKGRQTDDGEGDGDGGAGAQGGGTRRPPADPVTLVFVSATLAMGRSVQRFAGDVGLPDANTLIADSPFDYPRRAALWIPREAGDPRSPEFAARVARLAAPLIEHNRGRAFVLCTTLRAVATIAAQLRERWGNGAHAIRVLAQGESTRPALLEAFRDAARPSVLVGSAGFWEGVDVVGDALSLLIIDKLPFAPPDDPVVRARSQAIEARGGSPFAELSLPVAAMALKQGAGRLIRSETDRGLLVICDERLDTKSYGRQLVRMLPPFRRVRTAADALASLQRPPRD